MKVEKENIMAVIKIGAISFLNAKPIFYGIEKGLSGNSIKLSYDLPAESSEKVAAGELDVAIVPTIQYARIPDLKIVPGISISSVGPVGSVNLFCNKPLKEVKKIAVDQRSRTSVALLKILCRELYKIEADFTVMPPQGSRMLEENDAGLIIGDNALYFRGPSAEVRDLSADWFQLTQLPFVFAFLAGGSSGVLPAHIASLHQSLASGKKNVKSIAADHHVPGLADYVEVNRRYLEKNINFELGAKHLDGLRLFYEKANNMDLITTIPDLRFYDEK